MARPRKVGLDYFPFDVDADTDDKVEYVVAKHGFKAFGIYVKLLMLIYKSGYYVPMNDVQLVVIARKTDTEVETLREILSDMLYAGLFDKAIYDKDQVLTSASIQRRYVSATERRKDNNVITLYSLIDGNNKPEASNTSAETQQKNNSCEVIEELSSTETTQKPNNYPQSKVKESKVNNKTDDDDITRARARGENFDGDFAEVAQLFSDNIHPVFSEIEAQKLGDLFDRYGKLWCIEAIKETALNHGKTVKYIERVLDDWDKHGFKASRPKGGTKNDGAGRSTRKDKGEALSEFEQAELRQQQNRPWNVPPDERKAGA